MHPEDDAEGFKQLRTAYEQALEFAENQDRWTDAPSPAPATQARPATATQPPLFREALAPRSTEYLVPDARATTSPIPHGEARARLVHLLTQDEAPSENDLLQALALVLAPEARESVSTHLLLETWLADLLARTAPRSDLLIQTTIGSFGWGNLHQGAVHPAIGAVLRRRIFLENMAERTALEAALKGRSAPDADRLHAKLHRVLDEAVLYDAQLRPQLEAWLARLIVDTLPRSDVLVGVATARFGWRAEPDGPIVNPDIVEIVRRVRDPVRPSGSSREQTVGVAGTVIWFIFVAFILVGATRCATDMAKRYEGNDGFPSLSQTSPSATPIEANSGHAAAEQPGFIRIRTIGNHFFPYSARALRDKIHATVTLNCIVLTDGRLGHCLVTKETPPGYGFGKLSLSAVKYDVADLTDSRGFSAVGVALPIVIRWGPPHTAPTLPPTPADQSLSDEPLRAAPTPDLRLSGDQQPANASPANGPAAGN